MSSIFRRPTHPAPSDPAAPTSSGKTRKSIDASPSTFSISSLTSTSTEKRRQQNPHPRDVLHYNSRPHEPFPHADADDAQLGVSIGIPGERSGSPTEMYETSPGSSPRMSMKSLGSNQGSPNVPSSPKVRDKTRRSPRPDTGIASSQSPDNSERRRRAADERQGRKASPLFKRLGEEPPFMLHHPDKADETSKMYPGVVLGAFAESNSGGLAFGSDEMRFDGTMDDILDSTAHPQSRHDITSAPGANIAPWLLDDAPSLSRPESPPPDQVSQPVPRESPRKGSVQARNHFASVPALSKIRRQPTEILIPEAPSGSSSRKGSHPSIFAGSGSEAASSSSNSKKASRKWNGSSESVQTVGGSQPPERNSSPSEEPSALPPHFARQSNPAVNSRMGRLDSTASNISAGSGGSEKKKGFFGGLLRSRKAAGSMSMSKPKIRRCADQYSSTRLWTH